VVSFMLRPLYPDTQWIGGWLDLRAGLDDVERRKGLTLGRPARSQSLQQLRCPGSEERREVTNVGNGYRNGMCCVRTEDNEQHISSVLSLTANVAA
jgi:hypothetical protein